MAIAIDPLLHDPDGVHRRAIAALTPLPPETRARIGALARSADPFTDRVRSVVQGTRR